MEEESNIWKQYLLDCQSSKALERSNWKHSAQPNKEKESESVVEVRGGLCVDEKYVISTAQQLMTPPSMMQKRRRRQEGDGDGRYFGGREQNSSNKHKLINQTGSNLKSSILLRGEKNDHQIERIPKHSELLFVPMKFKTICNNKNWLDCSKSDREREMEKDNSNVLRENCQRDNQVRRSYGGKNQRRHQNTKKDNDSLSRIFVKEGNENRTQERISTKDSQYLYEMSTTLKQIRDISRRTLDVNIQLLKQVRARQPSRQSNHRSSRKSFKRDKSTVKKQSRPCLSSLLLESKINKFSQKLKQCQKYKNQLQCIVRRSQSRTKKKKSLSILCI